MTQVCQVFDGPDWEWDAFSRADSAGTHCHLIGWREVIEGRLGHRFIPLCARDGDGALAGVLPLVAMRSAVFGRYLVSLPFLSYGGPLGSPDAIRLLSQRACELARKERVKRLELRAKSSLPIDLPASRHKVASILDLPASTPAELLQGFPSKLRSQVRRAQKDLAPAVFGPEQVPMFHQVFTRHMTQLGTPTYSLDFFEAVQRAFGADAWCGCVYLEGQPIAGGMAIRFRDEVEMIWACALTRFSRFAPNMLLYWSFLSRAVEAGVRSFDFGRSSPGAGTHKFKSQWGTRDLALSWYGYSPRGNAGSTSSDMGFAGWAPRLWSKLPVPVAAAVGPWVRRGIPL